jgi:hypothetical protein
MPTHTSKDGNGISSWIRMPYPHFHLRDSCRHARYPRELVVCEHRLKFFVPRLCKDLGGCSKRAGRRRAQWCQVTGDWERARRGTPIRHPRFQCGARAGWVVERTFSWISRHRRMSKDYERHPCLPCETLIQVATSRLLLARLERKS